MQMSLLTGRKFRGNFREGTETVKIQVHHIDLYINIPCYRQIARNCGFVVYVEIKPSEEKHPEIYARKAREHDPATRLGFRVCMKLVDGREVIYYPSSKSDKASSHANTFVDWMQGLTNEEIAKKPRRYVNIASNNVSSVSGHLKVFRGGGYTDDNGNPVLKRQKRAVRSEKPALCER